jgi:PAS domain S-box-containing protein
MYKLFEDADARTRISSTSNIRTLQHLAFEQSLQPNIITDNRNGRILFANKAACALFGYSKRELQATTRDAIFDLNERGFKKLLEQKRIAGGFNAMLTAIRKNGKSLFCEVTAGLFNIEDGNVNMVMAISDMSHHIRKQKKIDTSKEKIVADNITLAASMHEISAQKSQARESRIRKKQIAEATEEAKEAERSDIGKELHDNVNQLLGVSKLYMDMAKRGGKDSDECLARSSEYTMTAIEEIRKLTKGLTSDIIQSLGLCRAIQNIAQDTMQVKPIKIICSLKTFEEESVGDKFKLNIFRIVQEQLNNILKHAKASKIIIVVSQNSELVKLSIADNGIGFNTEKERDGIGLENIKSRAASYGGTADFESQPDHGCTLTTTFPFTDKLKE